MGDAAIFRGLLRIFWARIKAYFRCDDDRCDHCLETFDHSLPGFFAHRKICRPDRLLLESAAELDAEFPEMPSLLESSGPRKPPRIEAVPEDRHRPPPPAPMYRHWNVFPAPPRLPPPDLDLFPTVSK